MVDIVIFGYSPAPLNLWGLSWYAGGAMVFAGYGGSSGSGKFSFSNAANCAVPGTTGHKGTGSVAWTPPSAGGPSLVNIAELLNIEQTSRVKAEFTPLDQTHIVPMYASLQIPMNIAIKIDLTHLDQYDTFER